MPFVVNWPADREFKPRERVSLRDSGDGQALSAGDELFIVSSGRRTRLLARLSVLHVDHDGFRSRVDLTVGGPRTAFFFARTSDAVEVGSLGERTSQHTKEATRLGLKASQILTGACGNHDFSRKPPNLKWSNVIQRVEIALARARRRGSSRPALEIAEAFLRYNFVTSQLPGPSPVYQNAARIALGLSALSEQSVRRQRHELTPDAVERGINEDVSISGHTPNTNRHQMILDQLRVRLVQLGLAPKYDGLVDCIVEAESFDIYFEVKSCSSETVVHQIRTGLGQVLHYMWMDNDIDQRALRGHLVVEGPWGSSNEDLRRFVETYSIRLTWSEDIPTLTQNDL